RGSAAAPCRPRTPGLRCALARARRTALRRRRVRPPGRDVIAPRLEQTITATRTNHRTHLVGTRLEHIPHACCAKMFDECLHRSRADTAIVRHDVIRDLTGLTRQPETGNIDRSGLRPRLG